MIKVVTWNVNSINSRLERVVSFLERENPDYLCLQELKCQDSMFPLQKIESLGYTCAIYGQKAYNGVAILSRHKLDNITRSFNDEVDDPAARAIAVTTPHFELASFYVPNGQAVGSEKFLYKLQWLKRAKSWLSERTSPSSPVLVVGDFNIAPDDRDVYDPILLTEHLHCSAAERHALRDFIDWGFIDLLRIHTQQSGVYSWWDYRELSFVKDKGLRIDLLYGTAPIARKCKVVRVDRNERKGDRPSDHAPVIAEFIL
jgi:exodeoxyribonuclease-3